MLDGLRGLRFERAHLAVIACCVAALAAHQSFRWDWYIDDAAICFAYARNLANGLGWVPWPGGERIEAVSDPTWVVLLAALYELGLDGFEVSKPVALLFSACTAAIAWRTAQRALPDHAGPGALIAPIVLAVNAQFAIWSSSGLENALFCLLLTGAIHRTVVEAEAPGRFPWGAVLYVGLAWTRPEGVLYAGLGGVVYAWATRAHGWKPAARWAGLVVAPLAASEAARIAYFAWPLPNTFYAKISSRGVAPLDWDSRGWNQLRDWAARLWTAYFFPVYLFGVTGVGGWRMVAGLVATGGLAVSLLWPGTEALRATWFWPHLPEPPAWLVVARVVALMAAGATFPLLALGTRTASVRVLSGLTAFTGLWFSVYANGDWMGAYRFVSLITPQLAVLFAVGATELLDAVDRWVGGPRDGAWGVAGWVGGALLLGLLIPPNFAQTRDHVLFNRNETTASVKLRADYTRSILRRTFWTEPVTNLEVDQGAHLWWNPDYSEIDMAMLVDVPMARHWYQQRDFVREYVFEERKPTFAHVGGWWAEHTGLRRYPEWERTFYELPGYQNLPPMGWFRNVFVRRELVMAPQYQGPGGRRAVFDWDLALRGWEQPAPWVPGEPGYLEAQFSVRKPRQEGQDVTVTAFLSKAGQVVASFSLPMGYGIYPMHEWKPGEAFRGRHAVPVPPNLPPGTYDLGFVLTGPRGGVIPVIERPETAVDGPPVFAAGEVRFADAIEVVDRAARDQRIDATRAAVREQAGRGACEDAERGWVRMMRHRPVSWGWHEREAPEMVRALADCWARQAENAGSRQVEFLARAHRWDPGSPELARVGEPVAERLLAEADRARDTEDWSAAYEGYAAVLKFQPWRAWARRYAETARDHRLGLTDDVRIGIGGENDLRAFEEANR